MSGLSSKRACLAAKAASVVVALVGHTPVFADEITAEEATTSQDVLVDTSKVAYRDVPVWEVGFGGVTTSLPHYPGSDQRRILALPFPYLVYRSDWLRVDGGSVSGVFVEDENLVVDVSLNGSLSVNSDDNDARDGMDDLDFTVELGPSIEYKLTDFDSRLGRVDARVAVRAVLSTDFGSLDYQGLVFNPSVKAIWNFQPRWNSSLQLSSRWATADFHDYFYGVDDEFATPDRAAYDGTSGYSGTRLSGSLWYRGESYSVGLFAVQGLLGGSVYDDSPLFRQNSSTTVGVSFIVRLYKSEETIRIRDDGGQ